MKRVIPVFIIGALLPLMIAANGGWDTWRKELANYYTKTQSDANYSAIAHASEHYNGGSDVIADATASSTGLATATQITKLDGIEAGAQVNDQLTENTTVNLTSAMTAAQIQALIDAQPKNLNGYDLTFQFADGTYSLNAALTFNYFNGGQLKIFGNETESTLSTTKSVALAFAGDIDGLVVSDCFDVTVRFLKITVDTDVADTTGIKIFRCPRSDIRFNYLLGNATSNGYGMYIQESGFAWVQSNYVNSLKYGICDFGCRMYSNNNDDTGTPPLYGLLCIYAGTIGKNGTQPAGSTANESASLGGVIR